MPAIPDEAIPTITAYEEHAMNTPQVKIIRSYRRDSSVVDVIGLAKRLGLIGITNEEAANHIKNSKGLEDHEDATRRVEIAKPAHA